MTIAYFLTCDDTAFAEPLMPRLIERAGLTGAVKTREADGRIRIRVTDHR